MAAGPGRAGRGRPGAAAGGGRCPPGPARPCPAWRRAPAPGLPPPRGPGRAAAGRPAATRGLLRRRRGGAGGWGHSQQVPGAGGRQRARPRCVIPRVWGGGAPGAGGPSRQASAWGGCCGVVLLHLAAENSSLGEFRLGASEQTWKKAFSIGLRGKGDSESEAHVAALSEPFPWDLPQVFLLLLFSRL